MSESYAAFTQTQVRVRHCTGSRIRVPANTSLHVFQWQLFAYIRVRITCKFHSNE